MRAAAGRPGYKARLAIILGLDGNPLRRASDRAEAWIRIGLLVIFMIAGPMAGVAAGQWAARTVGAAASTPPHPVRAVLLQQSGHLTNLAGGAQVWDEARWEGPGGATRTGEVPAPAGAAAGTAVTLWVNASGQVAGPPQPADFGVAAITTSVLTLVFTAVALLVVLRLIQCFLDWRRMAAWEAAWRATGPRWTRRRS